ncbi:protein diaphanous homolog 1-like isoform X2 [Haliaeetus albicilla]|uniref:protein diaphanous homolog 1-like isoform X2 n=1 Tax=Haliaeetus albicilla TaxID=8969 RepID=UPI0037E8C199
MGTHVLLLLLGCWVLAPCGAFGPRSHPQLMPRDGLWVAVGSPLILQCFCPGPEFHLFHGNEAKLVKTKSSGSGFVTFDTNATRAAAGLYFCRCPPGPISEAVKVVVSDPDLGPPELSLPPLQPLPVPEGTNISVVCKGPPGAATFELYRGGPGGAVGQQWVARGGGRLLLPRPPPPPRRGRLLLHLQPQDGGALATQPLAADPGGRGGCHPQGPQLAGLQALGGVLLNPPPNLTAAPGRLGAPPDPWVCPPPQSAQ